MYLSIIQVAESFGVPERVIEEWMRSQGMPHVSDRGRLLFDRAQVVQWAAYHGRATRAGFLASEASVFGSNCDIARLLRAGGIWRNISSADVPRVIVEIISALPGTTRAVRELIAARVRTSEDITWAPIGGGFALPHLSSRVALGREAGTVSLILLVDQLHLRETPLDGVGVSHLLFFMAPSPRAHLDLLGRLARLVSDDAARHAILNGDSDAQVFAAINAAEAAVDRHEAMEVKA